MTHNASAAAQPSQPTNPPDATTSRERVRVGSPLSLLAVVPGLLGFEPADSIVVIGTSQPGAEVQLTLRYDLPDPAATRGAAAIAEGVTSILTMQCITTAAAVGYGADRAVSPVAAALRSRAAEAGITLTEVLRAEDNRYWSYVCSNPACCPTDGTPWNQPVVAAITVRSPSAVTRALPLIVATSATPTMAVAHTASMAM